MENLVVVLVVEDEASIVLLLEDTLIEAGFRVRTCASGEAAIAELMRDISHIHAVVTDIQLGGCDGWAVARRARELAGEMPVIYLTGDSADDWTSKGVPQSVLIQKPFVGAQVVTAISNALNTHR